MTFSLVARCPRTGQFASAVASSSPAVAARCVFARAGTGAATSQNVTDPRLGLIALDYLAQGRDAPQAMHAVLAEASFPEYRQLTIIDANGGTAMHSGARTLGITNAVQGVNAVSAGNLLANRNIPGAMIAEFTASDPAAELGHRVLQAMMAGLAAGGEAGPIRSAGLLVVDKQTWPLADLRVDWHVMPLAELAALWDVWQPQMYNYVTRALNPIGAPSYGVPGDE